MFTSPPLRRRVDRACAHVAHEARVRGKIDHIALAFAQGIQRPTGAKESALEVHGQHFVPESFADLLDGGGITDTGAVDQNVQPAKAGNGRINDGFASGFGRHIARCGDWICGASQRSNGRGRGLGRPTVDGNPRPGFHKGGDGRATYAARASGDQHALVREIKLHRCRPFIPDDTLTRPGKPDNAEPRGRKWRSKRMTQGSASGDFAGPCQVSR